MSITSEIFRESSGRNSEIDHCRLCMEKQDYYYNIFTSNVAVKITVKDALRDLVGLQIAVGDGLPTTMCPLCFRKLTELSVFKKICLESDAALRKHLPKNYRRSAKGDRAADDKSGPSVGTKDGIRDVVESTSQFECSPQMTEVYIPVPDCLLSEDDKLLNVKEENEDQSSEENYPAPYAPNPAGNTSDMSDPLANDELSRTSTDSRGDEVDAEGRGAVLDWELIEVKKEPSPEESDDAKATLTENGEFIENWTMAHESTAEASGLPSPERSHMKTSSASRLQGERDARIGQSYGFLAPSTSGTLNESESGACHAEEGRNVTDKDLKICGVLLPVVLTPCVFPDDGPYYAKHIQESETSGKGSEMHAEGKPYACNICSDRFSQSSDLSKHMKRHDARRRHSCNVCGYSCDRKNNLAVHMRTHTGERPFPCDVCGKAFTTKKALKMHCRSHTGEKPYACGICNKCFYANGDLTKHMRSHTGEKPYSCSLCKKSFSLKSSLDRHNHTHTGKI
ncbi:zinc finger protein 260-like [Ischnura elegans]|uniref:zinc finger protein 260-like n=1 Tax=Ischnura elegans TaxID=197161 RepID=UPI001ED88A82|nr:zinc finger protein 260-like [Ischnura elegans]